MIRKIITDDILSNEVISHNTMGGLAPGGDFGLISEYSYTAADNSPDAKNVFRGYAAGQYINFGSTSDSTFDLADGTTISMSGVFVNSNGFATYEYIPQSAAQSFVVRFIVANSTSFPTFNDSNWFKTLRIINNTTSTTADIARSSFSSPSLSNDGTNGMATITHYRTATSSAGDSITIQLRSD